MNKLGYEVYMNFIHDTFQDLYMIPFIFYSATHIFVYAANSGDLVVSHLSILQPARLDGAVARGGL